MSSFRPLEELDFCWPAGGSDTWATAPGRGPAPCARETIDKILRSVVEASVIPRLEAAHTDAVDDTGTIVAEPAVEAFVLALRHRDPEPASRFFEAARARGASDDVLLLGLLPAAARRLGDLWCSDECDFIEVTIGTARLQQFLHRLRRAPGARSRRRRALLAAAPGDQHTFGISIVEEYFRRAGWSVTCALPATKDELVNCAASEPFDLVGLSVSCDIPPDSLAAVIRSIRQRAKKRSLRLMVGGRHFLEHPEHVAAVGADATAADARRAVAELSSLLD